jgi:hypothetical protein
MANADVVAYNIAVLIATLFLLEFGADKFIDHTAIVARRTGIPETIIGLLTAGGEWEEVRSQLSLAAAASALIRPNVVARRCHCIPRTPSRIFSHRQYRWLCHLEYLRGLLLGSFVSRQGQANPVRPKLAHIFARLARPNDLRNAYYILFEEDNMVGLRLYLDRILCHLHWVCGVGNQQREPDCPGRLRRRQQ